MTERDTAAPLTAEQIAAIRDQICGIPDDGDYNPQHYAGMEAVEKGVLDRLTLSHAALRDRLALVEGALRLCDDDSVATYLRQEARIKALEGAAAILTAATREVIQRVPNTAVGRLTEAIREYDALLTTPTAPSDGAAWAGDAE